MRRTVWLLLLICLLPTIAFAQTTRAFPNSRLAAEQPASDLTEAQAIGWQLIVDGTNTGPLVKTCDGSQVNSDWTCIAPLPALSVGAHILNLVATLDGASSAPSAPLTVTMILLQPPKGPRIVLQLPKTIPALVRYLEQRS